LECRYAVKEDAMAIRERELPVGWYPGDKSGVLSMIREFESAWGSPPWAGSALACIAPHAGWAFSGALAWAAWMAADTPDTAVIVGGHLPGGFGFLSAPADGFETPLGVVRLDVDINQKVSKILGARPDKAVDNTVEIHLPLLAARFPNASVAWFRAPNGPEAGDLGRALSDYADETGKKLFVLGSTDLTHYGPNYGWSPGGTGEQGRSWAGDADKAMAEAFVAMDIPGALALADEKASACSVGAGIAAMSYAQARGRKRGTLLGRASSADLAPGPSFVGYCAVAY